MYGEINMETCITIYKIDIQWEFAVWLRKLKQELCINLEGWDGEGDGREAQKEGILKNKNKKKMWEKKLSKYFFQVE